MQTMRPQVVAIVFMESRLAHPAGLAPTVLATLRRPSPRTIHLRSPIGPSFHLIQRSPEQVLPHPAPGRR